MSFDSNTQIVLGFHGCTEETAERILSGQDIDLLPSTGDDDWLGKGIYFWENAPTGPQNGPSNGDFAMRSKLTV